MKSNIIHENVGRENIENHPVLTSIDESSSMGWRSYLWDSEDKSHEVWHSMASVSSKLMLARKNVLSVK